jgi:hypothetical protein
MLLYGCSDPQSPGQKVRAVIEQMEQAAEARDVGEFSEHVSTSYRDEYGQGREAAARYARGYFMANQSIHLLTRIENLEFPATDEARATVLVGMVGRDQGEDWSLAADLYRFKVTLVDEDGEWKVTYAEWERG